MTKDFSFAEHAHDLDQHIRDSIPGRQELLDMCVRVSRRFVQSETTVVDIGCSTGAVLRSIRDENEPSRPSVSYVGIDTERKFGEQWHRRRTRNVRFRVCDARSFDFENVFLACSLFTMPFIPERDRLTLLRRVNDGLIEGGALIIAEKVLANSAKFQDILTFSYYDFKLQSFSAKDILDKERRLRGQMILWNEKQWLNALCETGFEVQPVWRNYLFVAWMATKSTRQPLASTVPVRLCAA